MRIPIRNQMGVLPWWQGLRVADRFAAALASRQPEALGQQPAAAERIEAVHRGRLPLPEPKCDLFGAVDTRHIEHVAARAGPLDAREISSIRLHRWHDVSRLRAAISALVDFLTGDVSRFAGPLKAVWSRGDTGETETLVTVSVWAHERRIADLFRAIIRAGAPPTIDSDTDCIGLRVVCASAKFPGVWWMSLVWHRVPQAG